MSPLILNLTGAESCQACDDDGYIDAPDEVSDGHVYQCVQPCLGCERGVAHRDRLRRRDWCDRRAAA
jgi:hypothetical protein